MDSSSKTYNTDKQVNYAWKVCVQYANMCFHFCPLGFFNSSHVSLPLLLLAICSYSRINSFLLSCQPSFSSPDAPKVKQEQCSVSAHLSCRNQSHPQLRNANKAWIEEGGGWMWDEERASASCILPSQHAQTHHAALPQQPGDHHSTQTNTDNLSKCTEPKAPNQADERSATEKTIERGKSTLLCLQVCKTLERESKHKGREREGENTPILQRYCHQACFACWQTMTITLKAKLPQEHLEAFTWDRQIITEQQHMQLWSCFLWNSNYQWLNI